MTTDQIFGQKGKVWYQEQQDIVSSSSWKKKRKGRGPGRCPEQPSAAEKHGNEALNFYFVLCQVPTCDFQIQRIK